jgi:hypothetical protein
MMLKKFAAIGLGAAIALAPLAALAQNDATAAPAASDAKPMAEKPMKKSTHKAKHHASSKKMKKPTEPAAPAEAPKS